MNHIWLGRYTKFLVFVTFLLVIAGGLVTSTKSGLSVPDWPLSYGTLTPPMVGGIRYEHTHRIIASFVGLMTLVLTIWLLISEKKRWIRWAGIAALGLVVTQGILGGLTVLYLLPAWISILHACLAQTFFAWMVGFSFLISCEYSDEAKSNSPSDTTRLKRLAYLTAGFIYMQLILGATLRHTGNRFVVISHVVGAFLVLIHAGLVMKRAFQEHAGEKEIVQPALILGLLTLIQLSLGMGAFVYQVMLGPTDTPTAGRIFFITSHQSIGALLLAASVFLILSIRRNEWAR